ncbi:hypothetical protein [Dactylosporangium sp. CA-092794]|uniref:hypothetical protein n=1 Tax=Dactylosporangium sp. CA-092794 TaxID=3239929 RepID=UPI003D93C840
MSEPRARTKTIVRTGRGGGGAAYFLGFIGALVYYVQAAHGFWAVVVAILKSLVWPAFLVYRLLGG